MAKIIPLDKITCSFMFICFHHDAYIRDAIGASGGIPVFDTQTGEILQVSKAHGPACNEWCCEGKPYELRCHVLTEIDRLDGLREVAEEECWHIPVCQPSQPPRYVEVPYTDQLPPRSDDPVDLYTYRMSDDEMCDRIVDWLDNTGKTRRISYTYERKWFAY